MNLCLKIYSYVLPHEPKFSEVFPLMVSVSGFSLCGVVNLNFFVFCTLFLKLRKYCQQDNNFGEKTRQFVLTDPIIFR
jgi:hypothetical protein